MFRAMISRAFVRPIFFTLLTLVVVSLPGCKAPQAFGDRNSVIVLAHPDLWAEVEDTVLATLERRVFTTRPERLFNVTYVPPDSPDWPSLRLWQEVVVIGAADDPIVSQIIKPDSQPPALIQVPDVWARTQTVSVLLVPPVG